MANLKKVFSDLDFTFKKVPGTGDVALRYDERAVINSVRNLLLTNHYEKPWSPMIGSNLMRLLFEPATNITAAMISDDITNTITNFEPRVEGLTVEVTPTNDENGFSVYLSFFVLNNTQPTTVNLILQRSR